MQIVLADWEWQTTPDGLARWRKPGGYGDGGGAFDMRTLPEQARSGGAPGMGLFAYDGDLPAGLTMHAHLGDDPLKPLDLSRRNRLADVLNIPRSNLGGGSLAEILGEQILGADADPTGMTGPKPLYMGRRGASLWLQGFGRLYHQHLDRSHPTFAKTMEVRRLDYARMRAEFQRRPPAERDFKMDALRRWNDLDMIQLGASLEELVGSAFVADGRLPHATRFTESWPTNGTTISSGQDLAWAEDNGDLSVSSGKLAANGSINVARCTDSDFSTTDQRHEMLGTCGTGTNNVGPGVRKIDSSTITYYVGHIRHDAVGSSDGLTASKYISGSQTDLAADTVDPGTGEVRVYVEVDGSNIYTEFGALGSPDSTVGPTSDTAITGNLTAAVLVHQTNARADDQDFGDLAHGRLTRGSLVGGSILTGGRLVA